MNRTIEIECSAEEFQKATNLTPRQRAQRLAADSMAFNLDREAVLETERKNNIRLAADNEQREKYWQKKAGRLASIANWALVELLERVPVDSTENEQANEYLNDVIPFLDFDEE